MNKICIYLRKSRADEELEKTIGEGETLSKHKRALLKFAKEKNLNVTDIKEEIVSGESLYHRPKMLELLQEVDKKCYSGVLVMDMQRLGRGDMEDQGIILKAFKNSNTKIITPQKTYDLSNEFDEEYSEFEAFMSRKELKMINRRMQGGRVRSVEDGNYIATNAPLGYDISFIGKNRTLKPNETESEIIKIIFDMYVSGNGSGLISDKLNSLGYKTKSGNSFTPSSVIFIIKNPVYIGKITWKKREIKKSMNPNKVKDSRTRDKSDWIVVDGKHKPIIDEIKFYKAQEIVNSKYHIPYQLINKPINPLAGLITCKVCGSKMVMRPLRGINRLLCTNKCGNRSVRFDYVERDLVLSLDEYLENYTASFNNGNINDDSIKKYEGHLKSLNKELETLRNQKLNLFDLLERGIYDDDLFIQRSKSIESRIIKLNTEINNTSAIMNKNTGISKIDIINFKKVITAYKNTDDVKKKNLLLKSILYKIEYIKTKDQKNDDFNIVLYPKLSR